MSTPALGVIASAVLLAGACSSSPPAKNASPPVTLRQSLTRTTAVARPTARALPTSAHLRVAAQSQLPALPNGCEVTSLAMLLAAVGHPVGKLELARMQPRDSTPPTFGPAGRGFYDVRRWGDPEIGFVGSVTGEGIGYGIYHRPLAALLNRILPGRALDLTGHDFGELLRQVAAGTPVVVWDTTTFTPTDDWVSWIAHGHRVRATSFEHAVLLVGYDPTYVYVNNPLTGSAAERVDRASFIAAWRQLGSQAISVSRAPH